MASAETPVLNGSSNSHGYDNAEKCAANINKSPELDVGHIAISPNAPQDASALIEQIASYGKSIPLENMQERCKLRDTARALADALETPRERLIRQCWSQLTEFAAIETAINLGIFEFLAQSKQPVSASELARSSNADPVVLSRILKHLGATGVITETGPDTYRGTNFSHTLSVEKYADGYPVIAKWFYPAIFAIPEFLKKNNYCNPTDPSNSAFHLGHNTEKHIFQCAQEDATFAKQFGNHMAVYRQGRPSWMDQGFYPVTERLVEGADVKAQDVLLVDMGGSIGHDISEFRRKWPNAPGRLVLQDLPEVIQGAKGLHSSIEPMAHDFFTEQPIKGARAYYLHSVLHDWPDEMCLKILANLVPALRPGYSKVLINENLIPPTEAQYETTGLDCIMMAIASTERTESHWTQLIESAGLKIVKIWTVHKGVESLIECEVA
ncbi:S-adenosyl-L-methionine-dependent methyltransferase [Aspergillus ambiguus]|uniref:S-adenosyl-L-methionine-dependent methyltransferase n=1 Tax=Aspergillus ambiguus TaxID=176160 RepID=UPI003CCD5739